MTPHQHGPTNSAQTLQFLSNILSQRGPTSVPYSEDVKWLIRQHLVSLTDTYPSLVIKTASFTHNDGRTSNLLQADGTIPMLYHNVTYNIPVILWLMDLYPRHPPLVYLNPTRDMLVKRGHPFVTPSGMVNVAYLQSWVYPSSNLVDLVTEMSACFARDPPLYSQRKPSPSPPIPSPSPPIPSPSPSQRMEDPSEVYRRNAINRLVGMVAGDVAGMRKEREGEVDALFSVQAALRGREERVSRGLREMVDEKEGLENQLQMVLTNADVLEGWLKDNEGKVGKGGVGADVDVDSVFEPCDSLSKQMLESSASDLAIEDVIYSLDKGVQEGVIPFDQYLKTVRLLSREQFFHRALSAKVRGTQMQARVASMAGRNSQYVL